MDSQSNEERRQLVLRLLNAKDSRIGGSGESKADILKRVKDFLPLIAAANENLDGQGPAAGHDTNASIASIEPAGVDDVEEDSSSREEEAGDKVQFDVRLYDLAPKDDENPCSAPAKRVEGESGG